MNPKDTSLKTSIHIKIGVFLLSATYKKQREFKLQIRICQKHEAFFIVV